MQTEMTLEIENDAKQEETDGCASFRRSSGVTGATEGRERIECDWSSGVVNSDPGDTAGPPSLSAGETIQGNADSAGTVNYIYTLTDPRTQAIRYVGLTGNPDVRLKIHRTIKDGSPRSAWVSDLLENGVEPIMNVVQTITEGRQFAAEAEMRLIQEYLGKGYPLLNGQFTVKSPEQKAGRKQQIGLRISEDARAILQELSRRRAINLTATLETLIHEAARLEGVTLPAPNSPTATEPPAPAQAPQDGHE